MLGNEAGDEEQLHQWKVDADAGDQDAQLLLGRHYLKLAQVDAADTQTSATLGVSFLIKSSKQGSEEATRLLLDCFDKDLGQYLTDFISYKKKKKFFWCMPECNNVRCSFKL